MAKLLQEADWRAKSEVLKVQDRLQNLAPDKARFTTAVADARAAHEAAQAELETTSGLMEFGQASKGDLDRAKKNAQAARATLDAATEALERHEAAEKVALSVVIGVEDKARLEALPRLRGAYVELTREADQLLERLCEVMEQVRAIHELAGHNYPGLGLDRPRSAPVLSHAGLRTIEWTWGWGPDQRVTLGNYENWRRGLQEAGLLEGGPEQVA